MQSGTTFNISALIKENKCDCESGFEFQGDTCKDIDECEQSPCGNGACTNTPGSYRLVVLKTDSAIFLEFDIIANH